MDGKPETVLYSQLITPIIKTVQEQNIRIQKLENENLSKNKEIEILKTQVEEINILKEEIKKINETLSVTSNRE